MARMQGKVALVTGAASGIGRATCIALAREGARVVVADINQTGGEETVARIGADAAFYQYLDVADEQSWIDAIAAATARFGKLNVLANVAGIGSSCDFEATSLADWNRMLAVNLTGVFLGCKQALGAMARAGEPGAIVNVASVGAHIAGPDIVAYCASKGGVRMLTKGVAMHCAAKGLPIRANSVNPTFVDSEMLDPIASLFGDRDVMRTSMARQIPIGRMATPADIANGVLFLASDEAAMVSGTELFIDGAQTAGFPSQHSG
ncbi:SDR family oxidoreductase [Niveispirillum sp.]|uniref:SDR family NAD(P)-dependent oxidoreductase n=1 Tax=Niveispirillum sp. TaxID=1917217 RepID=UPI001B6E1490|nr:SDR family oxidoreductase [Niveispirillum sp.]MBP7334844.1 SDR family oxidoreductase [Niveispirillum sp.]